MTHEAIQIYDTVETVPSGLAAFCRAVLSHGLAAQRGDSLVDLHDTRRQESIAALADAARSQRLTTFTLIVIKPDGRRESRQIPVDETSIGQALQ